MFERPQTISKDFNLAESPVWDFCQKKILFVDVNNRKIHSYESGGTIGVYVDQTNYVNGMIFEPDGHMLLAEMGGGAGGRITRMGRDFKTEVVIDHNTIGGALQTSDDLCRRSDGTIYFTDPVVSHGPYLNAAGALIARSFYVLKAPAADGGERELVNLGSLSIPNGIRLSRDEKTLFVSEMGGDRIVKYDVMPDGTLGPGKTFATMDAPDSFCMDAAGNFYVGIKTGLQVLRADGSKVTVIPLTSSSGTTNCGFGGPDGKTLWITAWTTFGQVDDVPIPGLDWYRNRNIPCQ
jgi:gluconolactonase